MSADITVEPSIDGIEEKKPDDAEKKTDENKHEGLSHLSPEDQAKILELRNESKKYRLEKKQLAEQLSKLEQESQARKEKELEEQGKFKELLAEKEKELEALKKIKADNEEYENTFKEQLETAMKKLSAEQIELIEDSEWPVSKKLKWAIKLSDENRSRKDTPGVQRPGGEIAPNNIDLKEYSGPKGRIKLAALRNTNPKLWQQIMDAR